jgi:hypothetical protein
MTVERAVRMLAGTLILTSLLLAHYLSVNWLWFTAFVGLNLLQSSITNWCPAMSILKMLGLRSADSKGCC